MLKYSTIKKILTISLILFVYNNYSITCFDLANLGVHKFNNKYYFQIDGRNITYNNSDHSINIEYTGNSIIILNDIKYRLNNCTLYFQHHERDTTSFLFYGTNFSHILNLDRLTH